MIILMLVYLIWLVAVIAWNFGVPDATPTEDVIIAIILAYLSSLLKKHLN